MTIIQAATEAFDVLPAIFSRLRSTRSSWVISLYFFLAMLDCLSAIWRIVIPSGLEPETVCLEGRCSIQLSYGTSCGRFRTAKFGRELGRMKSCRANSSEWGVQKGATPE